MFNMNQPVQDFKAKQVNRPKHRARTRDGRPRVKDLKDVYRNIRRNDAAESSSQAERKPS